MVVVPALTAVAMPVDIPIDATDGVLLLHVPPVVALVNVAV